MKVGYSPRFKQMLCWRCRDYRLVVEVDEKTGEMWIDQNGRVLGPAKNLTCQDVCPGRKWPCVPK